MTIARLRHPDGTASVFLVEGPAPDEPWKDKINMMALPDQFREGSQ
jgi:hypothetical protein